jgi:aerobic carbon-monoxide dehydrogenase medium subunit
MKPSRFHYHAPTSVPEALATLSEHGDEAKVLAGGQSLFPILNFRLAAPEHLVDINRLPGLDTIERTSTGWRIPALVRQRAVELSAAVAASAPLLTDALAQVAHVQIRNRGTVCGSLAHADASAELPTVMMALDARMSIASTAGSRTVSADEFFLFHMTTALEADDLLVAVEFDDPAPNTHSSFREFAVRKGDFCLAGVAVSATFDSDGAVSQCRVVAAGVAPTPLRVSAVEEIVTGSRLEARVIAAAYGAAMRELSPTGDVHADSSYRRQLASVLVRRALHDVKTKGTIADVAA